jgi:hypothetical protein
MSLFGRKTGGSCEKNDIVRSCFCAVSCLIIAQAHDSKYVTLIGAITKKYVKKPTVGFCVVGGCDIIIA